MAMTQLQRANCNAMLAHGNTQALRGLSGEDASRMALDLCEAAVESGRWFRLPELLAELRPAQSIAA